MYRNAGRVHHFVVKNGFAEVLPDRIIAMVDSATMPNEVDRARAERQRVEAERELATLASYDGRFNIVQAQLDEANAQLQMAAHGE